jgi:hypothetical protein
LLPRCTHKILLLKLLGGLSNPQVALVPSKVCKFVGLSDFEDYRYLHILTSNYTSTERKRKICILKTSVDIDRSTPLSMARARDATMCFALMLVLFASHASAGLCSSLPLAVFRLIRLNSPGVCRDSLLPPSVNSCFMSDYKFINSFMGL